MKIPYLDELSLVASQMINDKSVLKTIRDLKKEIIESSEEFVGNAINIESYLDELPHEIKSVWIFVLKKDQTTRPHYHPNSVQHSIMIEGKGRINIGGVWEDLKLYNAGETLGEDNCYIVMKKADHSFQPQDVDMVLISFHTVLPDELIEIDRGSGEKRFYI